MQRVQVPQRSAAGRPGGSGNGGNVIHNAAPCGSTGASGRSRAVQYVSGVIRTAHLELSTFYPCGSSVRGHRCPAFCLDHFARSNGNGCCHPLRRARRAEIFSFRHINRLTRQCGVRLLGAQISGAGSSWVKTRVLKSSPRARHTFREALLLARLFLLARPSAVARRNLSFRRPSH